ncbi:hypothetical protein ABI59_03795 [Acidobacteria bacterium Mor1]|nr:hypothetical protein ABI59_03795 [Acidobacteria bacterium Mor1]
MEYSAGSLSFLSDVRPRPVPTVRLEPPDPVSSALLGVDPLESAGRLGFTQVEDYLEHAERYLDPRLPLAELGAVERLRDQWYVKVHLRPVQWDPETGGLSVVSSLQVSVHFDGDDGARTAPAAAGPFESIYRETFVNYAEARTFRASRQQIEATEEGVQAASLAAGSGPRQRIRTRVNGPVRLDFATLNGTGFEAVPLSSYKLETQGVETPIQVFDQNGNDSLEAGDWIQFWGEAMDDEAKTALRIDLPGQEIFDYLDFNEDTVYFLTSEVGSRARLAELDAAPTFSRTPPTTVRATVRAEVDDAFRPLKDEDPWTWIPTQAATISREEDVTLPELAGGTGTAQVTVQIRGLTEEEGTNPDHRTQITLLNTTDQTLATDDQTYDGRVMFTHDIPWSFSGGAQLTSPLTVEIVPPTVVGAQNQVMLNFIEVEYDRTFASLGDSLVFEWPDEDAEFIVSGLSSTEVEVWELTQPLAGTGFGIVDEPVRLTGVSTSGAGSVDVRFRIDDTGSGAPRRFAVFATGALSTPSGSDFEADMVSDLAQSAGGDILVIAHRSLLDDPANCADTELSALLAYRSAEQGLSSVVACMDDVDDDFNFGFNGPPGIQSLLAYAYDNWATRPSYVLLLGDASLDYLGGEAFGSFVPTKIMFKDDISIGYYASDTLLGAVVGDDDQPEFMIGRLSARTESELDTQLNKVLDYEQSAVSGLWQRHALMVADRGKERGGVVDLDETADFERINDLGLSYMKSPPHTDRSLRYWSDPQFCNGSLPGCAVGASAMTSAIEDGVNGDDGFDGAAMMQFIGHGNFDLWSDDVVFCGNSSSPFCSGRNEVGGLTNGLRLPWVQVHNCLTGGFHTTALQSMGESWLKSANGGAIALYAPSGLGRRFIGEQGTTSTWGEAFGGNKERTLGKIVMKSVTDFCTQNFFEACQFYVLLGDPATRLQLPTVEPASDVQTVDGSLVVDLSWDRSDTAGAQYDIYRSLLQNQNYARVNPSPVDCGAPDPARCVYSDTTVDNNRTYYYYVVAVDADGFDSAQSNFNATCDTDPGDADCVLANPINPNPPSEPTGVAVADAETGGRLDVSWNPNPELDVDRYTVYYSQEPGCFQNAGCTPTAEPADFGETSHAIVGLENGADYYVVVTATNSSDLDSGPSVEVSGRPTLVLGLRSPGFISDLTLDKSGNDAVLSWSAVSLDIYAKNETVSSYEIYRGSTPDFAPTVATRIATVPGGQTTFTDPGALSSPDDLHYLVRAIDDDGFGGGLGNQLPAAVSDLIVGKVGTCSVTTGQSCVLDSECPVDESCEPSGGNLRFNWSPVTADFDGTPLTIDHYEVYSSASPISRDSLCDSFDTTCNDPTPLVDNLSVTEVEISPPGGIVYYTVISVDRRGNRSPF